MSIFKYNSRKPGPGVSRDAPPARGLRLFFQVFFREFFSLVKVNFLFYLFCLPVVTIPAAYCALTRIAVSMVRDQPVFLWNEFWGAFRSEFKRATAAGFLLGLGFVLSIAGAWYFESLSEHHDMIWLMCAVFIAGAVLLVFMGFSLFPMISLVNISLAKAFKNACLLVSVSFFRYILAAYVCVMLVVLVILLYPVSLAPLFLLYPSLMCLITVFSSYGGISKYVLQENQAGNVGEE